MSDTQKQKFVISGDSVVELVVGLAKVVRQATPGDIKILESKNKKGSFYGKWDVELSDDTRAARAMPPELSKELAFGNEYPTALGITIAFRKLVKAENFATFQAASAGKRAATIETLEQRLARLRAK